MGTFRKRLFLAMLFPLILLGSLLAAWLFRDRLWAVFSSAASVRETVASAGSWGVGLFVALQFLQVVVFVIPGEIVQIAGGWLFGVWAGSFLSAVGICAGSLVNFAVARLFGRCFVESLFGSRTLDRFEGINRSRRSAVAFFVLFVVPGIPKDALCFVAGLTSMRVMTFVAVSMVGRLPGIIGSSVMGQAVFDGRYGLFAAVAIGATLVFALGAVFKDRIHDLVANLARRASVTERGRRREEV